MPDKRLSTGDGLDYMSCLIQKEYGIRLTGIKSLDGEMLLASKEDGLLAIVRADDKENRLIFVTGIYDYITSRGFNNILKIHKALSGKYYVHHQDVHHQDGMYLVSEFADMECNPQYKVDAEDIVKVLANFHKSVKGYIPPSGAKPKSCWGRWIERFKKECKDTKGYRDSISCRDHKSPFEIMFLSSCDLYIDRMEKTIKLLSREGYLDNVEESMKNHQVCLGNLKQSNFCYKKTGACIISLDKCRYDMVECDISMMLQKLTESRPEEMKQRASTIIKVYDKENPLLENSINIIKAFLLYPGQYERICSKRSRGKNKWSEGEYMEKLKEAMESEDRKAKIAEALR